MPTRLADAVNTHSYPGLVHRYPRLLRLIHIGTLVLTLRVWYVRRTIRRVLRSTRLPFTYVDAGCGGGDFIFPYTHRFPSCTFIGIDRAETNVDVCSRYMTAARLSNVSVRQGRLEELAPGVRGDVVVCISVLQYTHDDARVLGRLRDALAEEGRLILYVPVNGRHVLPHYPKLAEWIGVDDYEIRQSLRRTYTSEEVLDKLNAEGFVVESATHSYGLGGTLYHEIYSLCLAGILHGPRVAAPFVAGGLILLFPLLLVLMLADYMAPKHTGNGLIIIAGKRRTRQEKG